MRVDRQSEAPRLRLGVSSHGGARLGDVVQFHTRQKLQLLAHSSGHYTALSVSSRGWTPQLRNFRRAIMALPSHRGRLFPARAVRCSVRDVASAIVDYQRGLTPLVVPPRLLEHYARLHHVRYVCNRTAGIRIHTN